MHILGPQDDVAAHLGRSPRRILVAGISGSGKTTLCRRIAARLEIAHTEIDALFHGPGWTPGHLPRRRARRRRARVLRRRVAVPRRAAAPARAGRAGGVARSAHRDDDASGRVPDGAARSAARCCGTGTWNPVADDLLGSGAHRAVGVVDEAEPARPARGRRAAGDPVVLVRLRSRREVETWLRRLPAPPGR
ncbi:hypothetical protein NKG05_12095 [Oerskovia sp. M15]